MDNHLRLGITKIGDLLLSNKITKTECGNPMENIRLTIPVYQRPYKWTAKNANQLFDDIEEARKGNKEVYRVGTLILHHDDTDGSFNIVDGQQRIITFALLLKCLGKSPIDFLNQPLFDNTDNVHNVLNNFRTFTRKIAQLFPKDGDRENPAKKEFTEYIQNHCELIVVITNNLSEAFQFFDSQNARGKSLYPHDLLKAYHLREMADVGVIETERIVRMWEDLDQKDLSYLFNEILYRLKEWVRGNRAYKLTEQNIEIFKGVNARDNHPFAQFYKGAFAYADDLNHTSIPYVTGIRNLRPFQINAPIIAGKPFFEYAKHYFDILADIRNNDKYEGYFINDNEIVKTLDRKELKNGVGNTITRLMFDTAILLYVDRFCPDIPSRTDTEYLDQFVVYAFIWAYSMRAQYRNVGWQVAQNYVMGTSPEKVVNAFNIYKIIAESDSPNSLMSRLADKLMPLNESMIKHTQANKDKMGNQEESYLTFFANAQFWEE